MYQCSASFDTHFYFSVQCFPYSKAKKNPSSELLLEVEAQDNQIKKHRKCILLFYSVLGLLLSSLSDSSRLVSSSMTDYGFDMTGCDTVIYCSLSPSHLTSPQASCHDMSLLCIHIFILSFLPFFSFSFFGNSSFVFMIKFIFV